MTGQATVSTAAGEPVRRVADIEEFTNAWVIHPISYRLTLQFAKLGITPNAVSLTGMLCGILAGVCYNHYRAPVASIAGFLLMVTWHVMDGADGQLARLTRSQSDVGKVLDGICDYVTFAAVYIGLALTLHPIYGGWIWAIVALAGACHAVQAAAYEVQRHNYEVWGCGKKVPPSVTAPPAGRHVARRSAFHSAAGALNSLYMAVQRMATGAGERSQRKLAMQYGISPPHDAEISRKYREAFAPAVRRWSVLSANYRTIAIFVFALAKAPLGYFVLEIVGGSAALAVLLFDQQLRTRRFLSAL